MICANCGGTIHVNKPCKDCGISYDDMMNNISHEEMKRLFRKFGDIQMNQEEMFIEESLMACELENSSLILPAQITENSVGYISVPNPEGEGKFIVLCTDMDEFRNFEEDFTPLTNSWKCFMLLLDDDEGFAINIFGECCVLGRGFLDQYFPSE